MGNTQHLLASADSGHLLRHLLGGTAADAGVYLVEHQGRHLVLLGKHILHGQHDTGQLTAGRDPVDRPQLLTHVGGHEKPHRVRAVAVQRLFRKIHRKADLAHVQLPQLL